VKPFNIRCNQLRRGAMTVKELHSLSPRALRRIGMGIDNCAAAIISQWIDPMDMKRSLKNFFRVVAVEIRLLESA
jgi:hypothetical protein